MVPRHLSEFFRIDSKCSFDRTGAKSGASEESGTLYREGVPVEKAPILKNASKYFSRQIRCFFLVYFHRFPGKAVS